MTMQMMNIRGWALGLVVLAGAGCSETVINDKHCSHAKGDETCMELFGGGFCSLDQEGCGVEKVPFGCVFSERPTDECYSPTGHGVSCESPSAPPECTDMADDTEGVVDSVGLDTSETSECGDGVRDDNEECDDGNMNDADTCTNACTIAACGDSITQDGVEECDDGNLDDTDDCTNACTIAVCGDWILHIGVEECDDGNDDDDDACVGECVNNVCGDGFLYQDIEACDDGKGDNTDDCTDSCQPAACGDGFKHAVDEQCDDGNMFDTDACTNGCMNAICGDSIVREGVEECDDGNHANGDGCSNCNWEPFRYVFVTSTMHTGALGGLDGADEICNHRADEAGLPGIYMAWISTNQGSPSTRFEQSTIPYRLPNLTKVAEDWAGLIGGTLKHSINQTELGGTPPLTQDTCGSGYVAWTGTISDGTAGDMSIGHCNNFTSDNGNGSTGTRGRTKAPGGEWTNCISNFLSPCNIAMPIYCFQQQ